jgi:hypothetical protein
VNKYGWNTEYLLTNKLTTFTVSLSPQKILNMGCGLRDWYYNISPGKSTFYKSRNLMDKPYKLFDMLDIL